MKRISEQTGASLIMIIAVTAVLVVLAASMVALVTNAQSSRDRDRHRAQTFNVAEAAMDDGLARLANDWPTDSTKSPVWGPPQETAFKNSFASDTNGLQAQYPTLRVKEWFYDNSDRNGNNVIDSDDYTYDKNGDRLMYVEVQAQDGGRSTRLRALAQRQTRSPGIPRGMVWYNYAELRATGGSVVFGVDTDGWPPSGVGLKAYVGRIAVDTAKPVPNGVGYFLATGSVSAPDVTVYVGGKAWNDHIDNPLVDSKVLIEQPVPTLGEVVYPDFITSLKTMAQSSTPSNYYTDTSELDKHLSGFVRSDPNDANSITPSPPITSNDDLSGIVYVDLGGTRTWNPNLKEQWNSPDYPGILVVDGNVEMNGMEATNYYGLIIATGHIVFRGTMKVHGILISAKGSCDLSGAQTACYNDKVWQNLYRLLTASARVVPNTWRELQPLPASVVFPP